MEHTTHEGEPKIVERCTLPLTGRGVVKTIITELAVIDVTAGALVVRELAEGITFEHVQQRSGAPLSAGDLLCV
jgi:acyl CoA:acetate/3-ketoacid CoA transferase beta subunit